eukprot:TRINITY_DN9637_c0_g1_i2.p1 TRINITY_DN9637_c0_g1~~TRINITY_DN9637_c0_g1_i2.p1  ORF type:complete len:441 (+),score=58.12 TRINITY_DN9637_c0_g1_i2:127-1323(+)
MSASFSETACPQGLADGVDYASKITKHLLDHARLQAVAFLFAGSISGMMAFGFAVFLGLYSKRACTDLIGEPFNSGCLYHPLTFSEMVHDTSSEEGKAFYAFSLIGAICILVSAYPWVLRNVYIGDDFTVPFVGVPFIFLRQFFPPVGMMMVCCITVTTGPRNLAQRVVASIHSLGAVGMIAGYVGFEVHALWYSKVVLTCRRERVIRKVLAIAILICAVLFQGGGALYTYVSKCDANCDCNNDSPWTKTCVDQWRIPTANDTAKAFDLKHWGSASRTGTANEDQTALLSNSACGWVNDLKKATFWFEVLAGNLMIMSHIVIWYYAPERLTDMDEELPSFPEEQRCDTEAPPQVPLGTMPMYSIEPQPSIRGGGLASAIMMTTRTRRSPSQGGRSFAA